MAKRSTVTPFSVAASIGSREREILALNPGSKGWGRDVNLREPILQRLNALGHAIMAAGLGPETEVDVISLEVVASIGNHSFVSKKTQRVYPATEPDEDRMAALLSAVCKIFNLRGYAPTELYNLESWLAYEEANGVE